MFQKPKRKPLIDKGELAIKPAGHNVEPREGMSKTHLAFIRSEPCCITGHRAQAHHLLRVPLELGGNRGMSMTNPDIFTVPLVPRLHLNELHGGSREKGWAANDEKRFFFHYGIPDPVELALEYARRSTDRDIRALAIEITGKKRQLEASPKADSLSTAKEGS